MEERRTIVPGKAINGRLGRWAPVAAWMALIFVLSAQSKLPGLGADWLDDLVQIAGHFAEYAVLGLLVARAAAPDGASAPARIATVILWAAAYAISDEWHQSFVPGRDASLIDWMVDMVGAVVGGGVFLRYAPPRPVRS